MRLARTALLASAGVAAVAALTALLALRWALAPPGEDTRRVEFEVPVGATLATVARDLEAAGLVRSALAFEGLARWRDQAAELRAGEYQLSADLAAREVLAVIAAGRVRTHELVIPEGLSAAEIALRVEAAQLASAQDFLAAVHDPDFARSLGIEAASLEGYLFPETYQLARGLSARAVVGELVAEFERAWSDVAPRAEAQALSRHELVTLASIVEKETGAPAERPLIAGVFHNRLRRGMRLETDPTVIYGIENFDGNLKRSHLDDASNPYNTYQIPGLPPGPIASPGADALRAVVAPAETDYLFFVSRNDGSHVFSRTYREHAAAVDQYQRRRRSVPHP